METKAALLILMLLAVVRAEEKRANNVPQEQGRTLGPLINGLAGAALGLFGGQNSLEGLGSPYQNPYGGYGNRFGNNVGNGLYGNSVSDYVNSISGNRYGNQLYDRRYPSNGYQQLFGYNRPQLQNNDALEQIVNLLGQRLGTNLKSYFGR